VGFLAAVPFAHAAIRLKQPRMWAVTAAYGAGTLVALVFSTGPEGGQGDEVLGYLVIALMIVATVHAFALRRRVFAPSQQQEVIAAALAARRRRERARAITVRDPALARELRIGRPDLPRQFDDGGLIDVNHVPAQVLVGKLGLSPEQAAQVAETRERLGGLTGPEELVGFSELSEGTVNAVRERLLFLADGVDVSAPPKPEAQPEPEQPPVDGHDDQPGTAAAPEDHQDDRPGAAAEDGQGLPPPGWYPDPAGGPGVRWWDGTRWADRAAEPPSRQRPDRPRASSLSPSSSSPSRSRSGSSSRCSSSQCRPMGARRTAASTGSTSPWCCCWSSRRRWWSRAGRSPSWEAGSGGSQSSAGRSSRCRSAV